MALDPRLTADGLAIIAYRATYIGKFTLHRTHIKRVFGTGDSRFSAAIANAQAAGYLIRRRARDGSQTHGRIIETLNLPAASNGYVFMRRSDMEGLDLRALAAFIFVAARPTGQHAYGRELSERFGWSPSTSMKWLAQLIAAGLIVRIQLRKNGRAAGCVYAVPENRAAQLGLDHTNQSKAKSSKRPKAGGAYGGIADWLASPQSREGESARVWSQAILAVQDDERLSYIDTTVLLKDLQAVTAHRISPRLLADDGLQAYRWLVCALCDMSNSDIRSAHEHLCSVLAAKIGLKPETHMNSWVYLIKSMYRSLAVTDGEPLRSPGSVQLYQDRR